jgi:tetratricopeptide (TPR) repeat protein
MSNLFMILLLTIFISILLLPDSVVHQVKLHEIDPNLKQLQFITPNPEMQRLPVEVGTLNHNSSQNPALIQDSIQKIARQALDLSYRLNLGNRPNPPLYLNDKAHIQGLGTHNIRQASLNETSKNQVKLLLEIGKNMLRTPYAQEVDLDKALATFSEAKKLSETVGNSELKEESLGLIAVVYLVTGDWEQGKFNLMQVVEARRKAGDKTGEIIALLKLAITVICDQCEENIVLLMRALELSKETGDQAWEALIRIQLGYKHLSVGNKELAEEEALNALRIQEKVGFAALCKIYKEFSLQSVYNSPMDYAYLSNAYYLLSDIGQYTGDLNQKLFYILKVVEDVDKNGLLDELDYTFFRLGNAYWELSQYDRSMEYHQKAADLSHQKGEFISVGLIRRMSIALIDQGKAKEALSLIQVELDKKTLSNLEEKMSIAQSLGACYKRLFN